MIPGDTVVAYDQDGARYCVGCWRKAHGDQEPEEGNGGPVFAVDEDWGTCDGCFQPIEDTL